MKRAVGLSLALVSAVVLAAAALGVLDEDEPAPSNPPQFRSISSFDPPKPR